MRHGRRTQATASWARGTARRRPTSRRWRRSRCRSCSSGWWYA